MPFPSGSGWTVVAAFWVLCHHERMPMAECPTLDELFWLFEVEPVIEDADLGWPIARATWTTERGPWRISVTIGVYDHFVEITGDLEGEEVFHVRLNGIVEAVFVDRARAAEALVIETNDDEGFQPVRLTLKPQVRVSVENRLPWEHT